MQLTLHVLSDVHPLVVPHRHLLEVDDVLAGGAVAVGVELELVPGQPWKHKQQLWDQSPVSCQRQLWD